MNMILNPLIKLIEENYLKSIKLLVEVSFVCEST